MLGNAGTVETVETPTMIIRAETEFRGEEKALAALEHVEASAQHALEANPAVNSVTVESPYYHATATAVRK